MTQRLAGALSLIVFSWTITLSQTPSAGGVPAADARFRLVRSVSGTKLHEEAGRFAIDDPRTIFYVPADQQVVVYFTWEGPSGAHHFEGLWKNPTDKVVLISSFEYTSDQPRFGGYFKMLLDAAMPGAWTVEARIDGESAGTHSFQVVAAARPNEGVSARHVLSRAEIYSRVAASTITIENLDQKGVRRFVGSGFLISPGRILTAFEVIESAGKLRIPWQGKFIEVNEVEGWNRRQDWVVLKAAIDSPRLTRASAPLGITDRCFFLDAAAENNRVLTETFLIGTRDLGSAGERLNIGDPFDRRAIGSPLVNDYGEVIGILGGSLIGGAFPGDLIYASRNASLGGVSRGGLAIPINLVTDAAQSPATIEQLRATGQFMTPLITQSILSGSLARGLNRKADPPRVIDERYEFSHADQQLVVFVSWLPEEKRKGTPAVRVFDLDNRLIFEDAGKKRITVNTNKLSYTAWELSISTLPPGIYRVDILLDADTVWRTFFRMVQ
jgi:S1-C subfamily serine protease